MYKSSYDSRSVKNCFVSLDLVLYIKSQCIFISFKWIFEMVYTYTSFFRSCALHFAFNFISRRTITLRPRVVEEAGGPILQTTHTVEREF
jgi:hypothetical protein